MATKNDQRMRPVTVSIGPELIAAADRVAATEDRSRSQVIRQAIKSYTEQKESK